MLYHHTMIIFNIHQNQVSAAYYIIASVLCNAVLNPWLHMSLCVMRGSGVRSMLVLRWKSKLSQSLWTLRVACIWWCVLPCFVWLHVHGISLQVIMVVLHQCTLNTVLYYAYVYFYW